VALELVLRARHCVSLDRLDEAVALARDAVNERASAPEAFHILGVASHRRGNLDEAEAALRRALERDRGVPAFHNDLGNVLQDRGKLKEAMASYRRALRLDPAFAEAWNDLGTAHYAGGEFEAAAECYRHALRLRADHVVAQANLGAVYRKLGLFGEARRELQRELVLRLKAAVHAFFRTRKLDLGNAASLAALGARQLESGNARHAADIARRALELEPRHAAALRLLSAACLRQGRTGDALAAARGACEAAPSDGAARLQLARALRAAGQPDEAAAVYESAPQSAEALAEQAELRLGRGEAKAAEGLLRRALALRADDPLLHAALGEAYHRRKIFADAERAYRRALELNPQLVKAHLRLSDLLRDAGRFDEAQASARRAVELDEESPLGHFAAAMAQKSMGRMDAAIEGFERARALDPERPQTLQQLGLALRETDRMDEAVQHLRAAVRLRPRNAEFLSDLGVVLADTMRYDEAKECFRRALELAPDSANTLQRQALLFDHLGERARGEELLRKALALAPDDDHAHYNLGLHHLKHGEYAAGWEGYERRRRFDNFVGRFRRVPLPQWDGSSLEGRTLLVLPEQGLGDEIMFGSCVPQVIERARHVVLECDAKLEALFRRSLPGCTVVPRQRTLANDWVSRLEPRPELQVAAGSLAYHFRRNLADFPARAFLQADANDVSAWRSRLERLGAGRKIGLSWRGGVGYTGKTRRSLSLEQLVPVLRLPGMHFVSLQYTDVREELRQLEARHSLKVHHWQEAIDDYDQTAALACALDGVLTVCTAIVHLSGGLGRPALVMVPFGADWRYGAAGERMPWYPSVRLVRQQRVAEWGEVLREVSGRLSAGAWP
jgi:tetratricopeptide (TPR) repeat protein